jgi:hypothetical protein
MMAWPKHVVIHVFNKARWNIVANEGLLYSFITYIVFNSTGSAYRNSVVLVAEIFFYAIGYEVLTAVLWTVRSCGFLWPCTSLCPLSFSSLRPKNKSRKTNVNRWSGEIDPRLENPALNRPVQSGNGLRVSGRVTFVSNGTQYWEGRSQIGSRRVTTRCRVKV